jgi:hypothetical protein
MRFRWLVICCVGAVLGLADPGPTQAQQLDSMEEVRTLLREFAAWSLRANEIYIELSQLANATVEFDEHILAFSAGERSADLAHVQVEALRASLSENVARIRADIDAQPSFALAAVLGEQGLGIQALIDETPNRQRVMADRVAGLINAAADSAELVVRGELNSVEAMERRRWQALREIFAIELGTLQMQVAAAPAGHPSRNLALGRIAIADTIVLILEAFAQDPLAEQVTLGAADLQRLRQNAQTVSANAVAGQATAQLLVQNMRVLGQAEPEFGASLDRINQSVLASTENLARVAPMIATIAEMPKTGWEFEMLRLQVVELLEADKQLGEESGERARMLAQP